MVCCWHKIEKSWRANIIYTAERKIEATAKDIADSISEEYIISETYGVQPGLLIDETMQPYFRAKIMLYRLAMTLLVLTAEEEQNPSLLDVRIMIERVFYEAAEEGESLFVQTKIAMKRLNDLLFSEGRHEFTWGISWFEEINIDETDPTNLCLFARSWMSDYVFLTKMLRDSSVVASSEA